MRATIVKSISITFIEKGNWKNISMKSNVWKKGIFGMRPSNSMDMRTKKKMEYLEEEVLKRERRRHDHKLSEFLFAKDQDFTTLDENDRKLLSESFPTADQGQNLVDILVETGLASSKGEARKLLSGNAISVNGEKITEDKPITEPGLIKRGKNKFALVR